LDHQGLEEDGSSQSKTFYKEKVDQLEAMRLHSASGGVFRSVKSFSGDRSRVLFVGQSEYFYKCALSKSLWAETAFVHFRHDTDQAYILQAICRFQPDVVICFRPEFIAHGLFQKVTALTVGFSTEPVPHSESDRHPDLQRRLSYLGQMDASNFDRLVHFDVRSLDFLRNKGYPYWRAQPLPLDWNLYETHVALRDRNGAIFVGRATPYRDAFLDLPKRDFNLTHLAHGVDGEHLRRFLSHSLIGINLHNEDYPAFENRVLYYFACGNLVLTQKLVPGYGLERDEDHLSFETPEQLYALLREIFADPTLFEGIRIFGAIKAKKLFNSEDVYRSLMADLYLDVSAYGRRAPRN
jgi:hypothetical protein